MTITELLQLRNRLSEEKRAIDRKLFIVKNLIKTSLFIRDYASRQDHYEYIEDYKGCSIHQDMRNGIFMAYDNNGCKVSQEHTLKMLKDGVDRHYTNIGE